MTKLTEHKINEFHLTVEVVQKAKKQSMMPGQEVNIKNQKNIGGKKNILAEVLEPCGSTELIKYEIQEHQLKEQFKQQWVNELNAKIKFDEEAVKRSDKSRSPKKDNSKQKLFQSSKSNLGFSDS